MALLIVKLFARFVVFGIALTLACRRSPDVVVEPKNKLPLIAGAFALLNAVLYSFLAGVLNLATLWLLFFLVPFVANGLLLLVTDKLFKSFSINSMTALVKTSAIVTIAHLLLRLAHL